MIRPWFPAHAITADNLNAFSVGAAEFIKASYFFEGKRDEWNKSIDVAEKSVAAQMGGNFKIVRNSTFEPSFEKSEKHYRQFEWVAGVQISGAEKEVGWWKARQLLEHSFNTLRIFVPSRRGSFMGIADETSIPQSSARFTSDPQSVFDTYLSSACVGHFVAEGFLEAARAKSPQVQFIERLLLKDQQWQVLSHLETRLLTALSWFGEAWKERLPVPKLVKFAISLEGLVMTGDKEGLTELLAERVAMLCSPDTGERMRLYEEVRELYRARSRAVHGDFAEKEIPLGGLNQKAEKLCRFALLSCADLFPFLVNQKDQKKALAHFFTTLKLGSFKEAIGEIQAASQAGGE